MALESKRRCLGCCYERACHKGAARWGGIGLGVAVLVMVVGLSQPRNLWVFAVTFLVMCPLAVAVSVGGCCCQVACHDGDLKGGRRAYDDDDDIESPGGYVAGGSATKAAASYEPTTTTTPPPPVQERAAFEVSVFLEHVRRHHDTAGAAANYVKSGPTPLELEPLQMARIFEALPSVDVAKALRPHLRLSADATAAAVQACGDNATTREGVARHLVFAIPAGPERLRLADLLKDQPMDDIVIESADQRP